MPYALQRRTLFFGAFTGANILRNDPPDRYVFNYRASYSEETDTTVRYLVKLRRLRPQDIAVFAQQDSYGDAGFAGVSKAFRTLGLPDSAIVRFSYKRNTVDVDEAARTLVVHRRDVDVVVNIGSGPASFAVTPGAALLASLYNVENLLFRLGWKPGPGDWDLTSLPNVLLPALVLLAAGAGAFAVQQRHRAAA